MNDSVIIDVRNTRCYVSRKVGTESSFTYEPCANWAQLEDMAADAVRAQGGSITLSGLYSCPDALSALALWPEDILNLVTTPQEAEAEFGLGSGTVRKAAEDERIPYRRAGATWLIYRPTARDKWEKPS